MPSQFILFLRRISWILLLSGLLIGCGNFRTAQNSSSEVIYTIPDGLSRKQAETLASLRELDDYPLYTMTYRADYDPGPEPIGTSAYETNRVPDWGCSLFAALGDPEELHFGRNFDWDYSPALLLYTDPPDGLASISMVDIAYLGFNRDRAAGLTGLPLEERLNLLDAPYLPFDGLNEAGLAVGMAAVPYRPGSPDSNLPEADSLMVIRIILDQAVTISQAVDILASFDIQWGGGPPLHYLIADASGRAVLVEFTGNGMQVRYNQQPWHLATNFLVQETGEYPSGRCGRYDHLAAALEASAGRLEAGEGMQLLSEVSQPSTQWSVVYNLQQQEVLVAMGGNFHPAYRIPLRRDLN